MDKKHSSIVYYFVKEYNQDISMLDQVMYVRSYIYTHIRTYVRMYVSSIVMYVCYFYGSITM